MPIMADFYTQTLRMRFGKSLWRRTREIYRPYGSTTSLHVPYSAKTSYELVKETTIPELHLEGIQMKHRSGATLVHLQRTKNNTKQNEEEGNIFSIAFNTPPKDSRGAAHILEHTVLCGSQLYPVKDPFFRMLNRSLASYMNAWTGPDWTMYPFMTHLSQDYANLRNVYLDAVFRPLLRKSDFEQEGWRIVEEDAIGKKLQGVVYNEMKGALSDKESLFVSRLHQAILAGTPYGEISGGDPAHIPHLSHEDLVHFHQVHYQPANCLVFSFGNINFDNHLEILDKHFDRAFQQSPKATRIEKLDGDFLRRWTRPQSITINGPMDPLGDPLKQSTAILSFLTNDRTDDATTFAWNILGSLLLDGPSAPLYQALLQRDNLNHNLDRRLIGRDYAPGTGYDDGMRSTLFSVGLQGISASDIHTMESLVMETLQKVRSTGWGLESARVDAIMHQIELALKRHSARFPLALAQRASISWSHGLCPLDQMQFERRMADFRRAFRAGGLFERLLDEYVLHNNHRLLFSMDSDENYHVKLQEEEDQLVRSLKGPKTGLVAPQKDDKSMLPCLALDDVPRNIRPSPFQDTQGVNSRVYSRITEKAQGVSYFKLLIPISRVLEKEEVALLPLLTNCLSELGVVGKSRADWDQLVKAVSGGISIGIFNSMEGLNLLISSNGLSRNVEGIFPLVQEALTQTNWQDEDGLRTIVQGMASNATNSIADNGHSLAATWSASTLKSPVLERDELLSGLSQIQLLDKLAQQGDWESLGQRLKALAERILQRTVALSPRIALIADNDDEIVKMRQGCGLLLNSLPVLAPNQPNVSSSQSSLSLMRHAMIVPFTSNYVGVTVKVPSLYEDIQASASLAVMARFLTTLYLHPEIREKGGAYGGSASYAPRDGLLTFTSYRDPNPANTIKILSQTVSWLHSQYSKQPPSEQDLMEAKLALFSSLDAPQSVSQEGLHHFLYGQSDQQRQEWRDAVFSINCAALLQTAERFLSPERFSMAALIQEDCKVLMQHLGFEITSPSTSG